MRESHHFENKLEDKDFDIVFESLKKNQETFLISPTGSGKTSLILNNWHRLLIFFKDIYFISFKRKNVEKNFEKEGIHFLTFSKFLNLKDLREESSLVILDEYHELSTEAYAYDTFIRLRERLKDMMYRGCKILGITATPTGELFYEKNRRNVIFFKNIHRRKENELDSSSIVTYEDEFKVLSEICKSLLKRKGGYFRASSLSQILYVIQKLKMEGVNDQEIGVICSEKNENIRRVKLEYLTRGEKSKYTLFTSVADSGIDLPFKPIMFICLESFDKKNLTQIRGRIRDSKPFQTFVFIRKNPFDKTIDQSSAEKNLLKESKEFFFKGDLKEVERRIEQAEKFLAYQKKIKKRSREESEKYNKIEGEKRRLRLNGKNKKLREKDIKKGLINGFIQYLKNTLDFKKIEEKILIEEFPFEKIKISQELLEEVFEERGKYPDLFLPNRYGIVYQCFYELTRLNTLVPLTVEYLQRISQMTFSQFKKILKELNFIDGLEKSTNKEDIGKILSPLKRDSLSLQREILIKNIHKIPLIKKILNNNGLGSFTYSELFESYQENKKYYEGIFRLIMPYFRNNIERNPRGLRTYLSRFVKTFFRINETRQKRGEKRETIYSSDTFKSPISFFPEELGAEESLEGISGSDTLDRSFSFSSSKMKINAPPDF